MSAPGGGEQGASRSGIPKGANGHGDSHAAQRGHKKGEIVSPGVKDLVLVNGE